MSTSWLWHVATPILAAVLINLGLWGWRRQMGANTDEMSPSSPFLPPGYVIGGVWVVLLGLLGYAHYRVRMHRAHVAAGVIVLLGIFCLAYPILTSGLTDPVNGLVLDTLALVFSFATLLLVCIDLHRTTTSHHEVYRVLLLFIPLLAWVGYVNVVDAIACGRQRRPRQPDRA